MHDAYPVNIHDDDGMKPLDMALEDCNEHAVRVLAPLTEDLTIAGETRNHEAYVGNAKFLACLETIHDSASAVENLALLPSPNFHFSRKEL